MEDDGQGRKFQKDLNAGLVALVLLAVLERSPEDLYGYEIAKRLQRANEGDALFKEGTIYPVLRTLSASGLLTSRIVPGSATASVPSGLYDKKLGLSNPAVAESPSI